MIGLGPLEFGLTLTLIGMGGTLLTLWLVSLLVSGLKKLFPYKRPEGAPPK